MARFIWDDQNCFLALLQTGHHHDMMAGYGFRVVSKGFMAIDDGWLGAVFAYFSWFRGHGKTYAMMLALAPAL